MSDDLRNKVIAHIESYHPSNAPLSPETLPVKKYLPDYLTVTEMYGNFCEKNPVDKANLHYESYRKILSSMNIKFTKLGEEECEECEVFAQHECPRKHEKENKQTENEQPAENGNEKVVLECNVCDDHAEHVQRAEISREMHRKDATSNTDKKKPKFSMNMQKVMMLPHLSGIKTAL